MGAGGVPGREGRKAGAANTLYRNSEGQLVADNTDGHGLVRDLLANHSVQLKVPASWFWVQVAPCVVFWALCLNNSPPA